ncbi:unnamed protein product [Echinostoma caproni]|uniref:ANAPC4_WD40 domain-containing protein n=1 Tax=Echinostoma caproni TaxID=27848 RepID=A0A183AVU6_9TREM|nr:unnamed protein product [Echinostoma caproni]
MTTLLTPLSSTVGQVEETILRRHHLQWFDHILRYQKQKASEAVLLFNVGRYLEANNACSLRKDKPLPEHAPDIQISSLDPVSWISFNNEGLVLAVATSSSSKGTFVHLMDLRECLKHSICSLSEISRPIRVCGGEQLTADGNPGWEMRDFAWNPTVHSLFVTILRSGAVRLVSATPNPTEPEELVDQLPLTVDARCLSWSTKGKQLAICIMGTLITQTGPLSGPLILQTDPKLRLKRIVQLNTVFGQIDATGTLCPLDVLWTSPSCFVMGLRASSQSSSISTMRTVMVYAPTKSNEVSFSEIVELRLQPESPHHQFYLQSIGSGHFVATQSAGGEQMIVFQIPSGSTAAPAAMLQIELPPSGFVLGLALGFHWPSSSC